MADGDFYMSTGAVSQLSADMASEARKYFDLVANITGKVDALAAYWVGDTYDNFKTTYTTYKNSLNDLNEELNIIANSVQGAADSTADAITSINRYM